MRTKEEIFLSVDYQPVAAVRAVVVRVRFAGRIQLVDPTH